MIAQQCIIKIMMMKMVVNLFRPPSIEGKVIRWVGYIFPFSAPLAVKPSYPQADMGVIGGSLLVRVPNS